jgi:2-iminobutanoate/2-iminopropanoate deaminase
MREAISSPNAPKALGPYSPAVRMGSLVFVSGQIPIDPATGELVEGDVTAQTRRVMENLGALLRAAGLSFDAVARTTVYLIDLAEFPAMNAVYGTYFPSPAPARSTIQVSALPKGSRVKIDVIAVDAR